MIAVDYVIATPAQLLQLKHCRAMTLHVRQGKTKKLKQLELNGQSHF
jgi:hypothetical protein